MKYLFSGKSTCDAMSSIVKRTTRLRSLSHAYRHNPITTPLKMFEVAQADLTSPMLEFLYVTRDDVDYYRESLKPRYAKMRKIKGTRQWHYVAVGEGRQLITKRFGFSTNCQTFDVIVEDDDEEMEVENTLVVPIIGEFYAIALGKTYQIGVVLQVFAEQETTQFQMMKKAGKGGVSLTWPPAEKLEEVDTSTIIMKVSAPVFNEQKQTYRLTEIDVTAVREAITKNITQ